MNIEKERLEKILSKLFKFIQQNNNELINEFIKSAEITGEEVNEIQLYINNEDDGFLSDGYIRSLVTEEMYNIPLENLDLGLRAYQCISRANVKRLRDLKCIYCFCKIRNLGRKCLFELISKLEALLGHGGNTFYYTKLLPLKPEKLDIEMFNSEVLRLTNYCKKKGYKPYYIAYKLRDKMAGVS